MRGKCGWRGCVSRASCVKNRGGDQLHCLNAGLHSGVCEKRARHDNFQKKCLFERSWMRGCPISTCGPHTPPLPFPQNFFQIGFGEETLGSRLDQGYTANGCLPPLRPLAASPHALRLGYLSTPSPLPQASMGIIGRPCPPHPGRRSMAVLMFWMLLLLFCIIFLVQKCNQVLYSGRRNI